MDTEHLCDNSAVCISQIKVCDGYHNCPEGDDEAGCVGGKNIYLLFRYELHHDLWTKIMATKAKDTHSLVIAL